MGGIQSIELALRVAAREATAGGFREVTPAHLLIALCRLSEPDTPGDAGGAELQAEFQRLGIDSRRFRRCLRALLGTGGASTPRSMHRSQRCKEVFARAQAAASREGVDLSLVLLLHTTLASLAWSDGPEAAFGIDPAHDPIPHEL
jgi:hypothetical protein